MFNLSSGIMDKTRLVSNILMLLLVAGNIFFSIQYTQSVINERERVGLAEENGTNRVQVAKFLKYFIDTVLNTQGTISFDDRVKLENDIRQIKNPALINMWNEFVNSADSKVAQANAVKLMSMLTNIML